jgi:hypothetical protein
MISVVLAFALAGVDMQSDTTRASREAFNNCLRNFMQRSIDSRMTMDAFTAAYAEQCRTEEAAYRAAIMQRERSFGSRPADAEQAANEEIEDARANFRDQFEASVAPRPN